MGSIQETGANPKIFVLDPYHQDAITLLQSTSNVDTILPSSPERSQWPQQANALLLRSETKITRADLASAFPPHGPGILRAIVKQGVGVDNIDLNAARKFGIAVHNTPALNSEAVAELCMAVTLSLTRRVSELDRRIRNGEKVIRSQCLGMSMYQKTIGVVGMGNIGKLVAQKWRGAFDCQIIAFDPMAPKDAWNNIPHTRVDKLEDLLKQSDMVTLHVPLTSGTRDMIAKPQLAMMKITAVLVNCARGSVVNEKDLAEALKNGTIWGAAVDAFEIEPVTKESYSDLLDLDNLIMTPHIGGSTRENQSKSGTTAAENLLRVLGGEKDVPGKLV